MQKLIKVKQGLPIKISYGSNSIDKLKSRLNELQANGYTHIDISTDDNDTIIAYPYEMRKETYQEWKDRLLQEKESERKEMLEYFKQKKIRNKEWANRYEIDGYRCSEMCLCEHSSNFPDKCKGCDHLSKI